MKKLWIITSAITMLLVCLGLAIYLRPSPQDQLISGIKGNDVETIRKAMDRGADSTLNIDWDNTYGITPGYTPFQIHLMIEPKPEVIKLLLQKADLSVVSNTGTSIEPDSRDGFAATPLQYLVFSSNRLPRRDASHAEMLQLMLDHGAPTNATARYPVGLTALMVSRHEWVIKPLLEAGADPNMATKDGACLMNYHGQEPTHPLWKLLKKHGGRPRKVSDSPRFPRPIWGTNPASFQGWKYSKA